MNAKHLSLAKQLVLASALAGVLTAAPCAMATEVETSDLNAATPVSDVAQPAISSELSLTPTLSAKPADNSADSTNSAPGQSSTTSSSTNGDVKYFDAEPDAPNIHGFSNLTVTTDYATPRGLIVIDKETVLQPIVGLVFPFGDVGPLKDLTFVGGIWNNIAYAQHDPNVGPWNELDDFFSLSFDPIKNLNANFTYVAFNSPDGAFTTEHNSDVYLSYTDTDFWGGNFGLHPYLDIWWAMAGDSTVILGKHGNTFYAQPGLVPTYTFKEIPSYPVTVKVPMYLSVGPKDYWSTGTARSGGTWGDGNVGLFNVGVDVGVPLAFIPTKYGYWHADASVTYFDLIDNALLDAGTLASGNTRRDLIVGAFTLGFNF
jgi:hypothetical protein